MILHGESLQKIGFTFSSEPNIILGGNHLRYENKKHGALDYVHSSLTFAPENVPCYTMDLTLSIPLSSTATSQGFE